MALLPDDEFYTTHFNHPGRENHRIFHPWEGYGQYGQVAGELGFGIGDFRLYTIWLLANQSLRRCPGGEVWECGVWKGYTAKLLAMVCNKFGSKLRLFDTFEGMPETNSEWDGHKKGDFADTSLENVREYISEYGSIAHFHKGFIPETFVGLTESNIAFAHVDVDILSSVHDCLEFIYPRLMPGGALIIDDYGWASCPGARQATDVYFAGRADIPLALPTGQSIVLKASAGL